MGTTVIRDLIILGRACPEETRSGQVTVCTAGYSHELGFVRVYPTTPRTDWKRWDIAQVPVERPTQDTRHESWKIAGSRKERSELHRKITIAGKYPASERLSLIESLTDPSVEVIKGDDRSLGIIKPSILSFGWVMNDDPSPTQLALWRKRYHTKTDFDFTARVRYRCPECRAKNPHDQQILEWGFYEWLRKHPEAKEEVWENAKFTSSDYGKFFLVGNQFLYRASFLVISVIRLRLEPFNLVLKDKPKVTYRDPVPVDSTPLESPEQPPLIDLDD